MENPQSRGPRLIGGIIVLLIVLFFVIEFFYRYAQDFSPTSVTNVLLSSLQIIVLLLFLVLLFVLGRNLVKLYLERKRKVVGARFKTKLLLFFIALSFIPTLLLFFFASDLISRNIESWFKTEIETILNDTKDLADGFYTNSAEITQHYALQLSRAIQKQNLIGLEKRGPLMEFVRNKLTEYKLDEIGIYVEEEELFSYLNPNLPLQYYKDLQKNTVKRAHLGENVSRDIEMGNGQMIQRGLSQNIPGVGNVLVVTGKFLPQNYAQKINNITEYVQRYRRLEIQKQPFKTFYLITLIFVTLLIIFAASWIGFQLAKGITVPIEKLAHATREVSRGNLDVQVEDPASDEVGMLIESFNQMIVDLKEGQKNIAQKTSELASRKQYIETILDNINTGVISLNAAGLITTINPSARKMLSLPMKNLIGKNYKEVLSHSRYKEIVKGIESGPDNSYNLSDKEVTINFDGYSVMLALSVSPLKQTDEAFSGMIVVLDNLTQLIKAQKIAAWKEVAQRVAHEIKNPLTPIQLSAERIIKNLGKEGKSADAVIKEGANTIVQEAGTIKSLVDEFTNFARLPNIQLQPSNIHDLLDQTTRMFTGIFNDIKFRTLFSSDVPATVSIDGEQMKRVFINLIDNAIDAMNKNGTITIRTGFDRTNRKLEIEIADSGPGISEQDKEKLFLPHFSTKKKGTGLGLAIVSQVIREHNGSIDVKNNEPHGAKFIIRIPV